LSLADWGTLYSSLSDAGKQYSKALHVEIAKPKFEP
jgi:hypothetical protein